jgi:hypothetical protein
MEQDMDQMRKIEGQYSPACKRKLRAERGSAQPLQIRQLAETVASIGFVGFIIADEHDFVIAGETHLTRSDEGEPT